MAIAYLLGWWYGQGWVWAFHHVRSQLEAVNENFSVGILLRTWFAPWKQIQSPGSLRNFMQSAIDNFISRFIGASVRTIMLFTALLLNILLGAVGIVVLAVWPLLPLLVIALPTAWLGKVEF